ncbi:MAG: hypothetical protein HY033_10085 [Ignavibacteriae bacterium]|nr:hypothetical protein [Ignavibacteria bacterium]MBI3365245.1 hypothetical protein [Ignavibacteriota bacterium]
MDERLNRNGEENHPVRKVLQSLRRVQASADFEQRLQRRVAISVRRDESGKISVTFPARRPVPAFAYSVIAVFVVGVLAYYMLVRTGVSPTSPNPNVPVLHDTVPHETGNLPNYDLPQPVQQNSQSVSKEKEESNVLLKKAPKREVVREEQLHGEMRNTPVGAPRAATEKRDVKVKAVAQPRLQDEAAAETRAESEEVMPPPAATQKRMVLDQAKSTTGTLELKPTYDSSSSFARPRIVEPRVKDGLGIGVMNGAVTSPMKDSVKIDSLKKLQRNILQTKTKGKKPID